MIIFAGTYGKNYSSYTQTETLITLRQFIVSVAFKYETNTDLDKSCVTDIWQIVTIIREKYVINISLWVQKWA